MRRSGGKKKTGHGALRRPRPTKAGLFRRYISRCALDSPCVCRCFESLKYRLVSLRCPRGSCPTFFFFSKSSLIRINTSAVRCRRLPCSVPDTKPTRQPQRTTAANTSHLSPSLPVFHCSPENVKNRRRLLHHPTLGHSANRTTPVLLLHTQQIRSATPVI